MGGQVCMHAGTFMSDFHLDPEQKKKEFIVQVGGSLRHEKLFHLVLKGVFFQLK